MEYKVNITDVPGSGKDGRILKEDVIRYAEKLKEPAKTIQRNLKKNFLKNVFFKTIHLRTKTRNCFNKTRTSKRSAKTNTNNSENISCT